MPTVLRHGGYRFFLCSNEGRPREPPHVHVERGDRDAKVWIGGASPRLDPDSHGFPAHELSAILGIVAEHRAMMEAKWHERFR